MNKWFLIGAGVVIAVSFGFILFPSSSPVPAEKRTARTVAEKRERPEKTIRDVASKTSAKTAATETKKAPKVSKDWFEKLEGEDGKLAKAIVAAADAGDVAKLRSLVPEALKSGNREVRLGMVTALAVKGEDSMSELMGFLKDADEEVAGAALDACDASLSQMADEQLRATTIKTILVAVPTERAASALVPQLAMLSDKKLAKDTLWQLMRSGEAADETVSAVAADLYIQMRDGTENHGKKLKRKLRSAIKDP